jgi:hypothetical protein
MKFNFLQSQKGILGSKPTKPLRTGLFFVMLFKVFANPSERFIRAGCLLPTANFQIIIFAGGSTSGY